MGFRDGQPAGPAAHLGNPATSLLQPHVLIWGVALKKDASSVVRLHSPGGWRVELPGGNVDVREQEKDSNELDPWKQVIDWISRNNKPLVAVLVNNGPASPYCGCNHLS